MYNYLNNDKVVTLNAAEEIIFLNLITKFLKFISIICYFIKLCHTKKKKKMHESYKIFKHLLTFSSWINTSL